MTPEYARGPSPARRRLHPRGARIVASLATLALLGAAPSAAQAANWIAGPSFAAPATAFTNDFVLSPNGASTAAWYEPATAGHVAVQRAAPDGTLGAPLDLGIGGIPMLATSASNLTAVAWLELTDPAAAEMRVHLTQLDANGARTRDTVLDTLSSPEAGSHASVDVALDAAGNATVVWARHDADSGDVEVLADRVAPDGSHPGAATLGTTDQTTIGGPFSVGGPAVVTAPDGTTWIGWRTEDRAVDVTRWPSGGTPDATGTKVSADGDEAASFRMTASSAGAAVAWIVPGADETTAGNVRGTRLNATGSLAGAPFRADGALALGALGGSLPGFGAGVEVAIGPDGVVTLGWNKVDAGSVFGGSAVLSRFAPGQATTASTPLGRSGGMTAAFSPSLDAAADGSILATWLQIEGTTSFSLVAARIAPDGQIGAASTVTSSGASLTDLSLPIGMPRADDHGGGVVGVNKLSLSSSGGAYSFSFGTYRYDSIGPVVTVDVPATAVVFTPVVFRGAVADPANAPLNWDFGDGSSGRGLNVSHVYAGPGTYTVTASASDLAGNETVVTRQIAITPAQVPDSGRRAPTPPAAAALKIARAVRSGAKVTVSGTIARSASGKLTVVYAQRSGGATITVKKTAKIAKGRWSTALALPRVLTRGRAARAKGTVTVTYAGSTALKRTTAKRGVTFARARRARRAARAKQRAAAHRRR